MFEGCFLLSDGEYCTFIWVESHKPIGLTDLIIMDFAKAFDKVSHRRLLYKLEYYGIQTHTLSWIQAFLTHRTQTVVIDGVTSKPVGFPPCSCIKVKL
jgi:hypothetical protein